MAIVKRWLSRYARSLALGAVLSAALLPILTAHAVNPDARYHDDPCFSWVAKAGATGASGFSHPAVTTYGDCYQFLVSSAAFKGSDSQYYWYYGSWQTGGGTWIHFCSGWADGSGTCYWADIVIGNHQVEEWPAIYGSDATYAECIGC